jgi:hypothetical protein
LGKGSIVVFAFGLIYIGASLNPDIMAISVNEVEVNVVTGLYVSMVVAYIAYGKQIVEKFAEIIMPKTKK